MIDCKTITGQQCLNRFYLREIGGPEDCRRVPEWEEYPPILAAEAAWNRHEEARLPDLSELPGSADGFRRWYQVLHRKHRTDVEAFFEFLAHAATPKAVAFYIGMEEQVDGRFDDVIALAQLGMRGDMKLALAENYWDEMGLGRIEAMHTEMFAISTRYTDNILKRAGIEVGSVITAEAIANGNLLLMWALRRKYVPRLLGALTILEHTAPYRFARTVKALQRIGAPPEAIAYHDLHIEVDANHGKQMIDRVLTPFVANSPDAIREVCIGCLIRYQVAIDYYRSIERVMLRVLVERASQGCPI